MADESFQAGRDVPVLLMLFNRPEATRQVFEKLREIKPARLFLAANGPRPGNAKDRELCAAVRAIFTKVDWPCEIKTNFRETNIGMQPHWRLALDWFFESVESGVILEDDCVPHPGFLGFMGEMLERYKDEDRIMHVNASNFQFGKKRGNASYYFSKYPHVWGWATWKRAWRKYDNALSSFPSFKRNRLIDTAVEGAAEKRYWMKFFEGLYAGTYDTCDVKWLYAIWAEKGLCITPNVNMISNIGHGFSAGNTVIKEKTMGQEARGMGTIAHPDPIILAPDIEADAFTFKACFRKTFFQKARYKILMAFKKT